MSITVSFQFPDKRCGKVAGDEAKLAQEGAEEMMGAKQSSQDVEVVIGNSVTRFVAYKAERETSPWLTIILPIPPTRTPAVAHDGV